MKPTTCEEPVSERRDDSSADNNRNESRPVHILPSQYAGIVLVRGPSRIAGVDRVKGCITATGAKSLMFKTPSLGEQTAHPRQGRR